MASKDKVGWAQVWVGLAAAAVVVALVLQSRFHGECLYLSCS